MSQEFVTLKITRENHIMLLRKIDDHKNFLLKFSMHPELKKTLMRDIHVIRSIINETPQGKPGR